MEKTGRQRVRKKAKLNQVKNEESGADCDISIDEEADIVPDDFIDMVVFENETAATIDTSDDQNISVENQNKVDIDEDPANQTINVGDDQLSSSSEGTLQTEYDVHLQALDSECSDHDPVEHELQETEPTVAHEDVIFHGMYESELRNVCDDEELNESYQSADEELCSDESDLEFEHDILFDFPEGPLEREETEKSNFDSDPLYPGAAITIGAFMLLLAVFVTQYNLIGEATEHLLKILALALPNGHKLCTTLYEFKLFFKTLRNPLLRHYYCSACSGYIKDPSIQECPHEFCKTEFSMKTGSYFVEVPLENQVKNLFAQKGFYNSLGHRFRRNNAQSEKTYCDIYDGNIYKKLMEDNGILSQQENISFTFNTDGAPVFKSSKTSIWPVYLVINELPYKQRMRKENMILACLWYGNKKPSMGTFLKPFLESLKKLKEGIVCSSPDRGDFTCKGVLLCGTADLPARSLLCNHVQYNGAFSCWKCEQEGETARVGKGHARVFPFNNSGPKDPKRTCENVLDQSKEAIDTKKSVKGIKGPSWLFFAPLFDIVSGIAIDYMHGVLLGVQKMLLELWFGVQHKGKAFNFYESVCEVDRRLQFIKPTLDVTRLPRSIEKDLKYWKASEYRSFVLYFGAPVLLGILDDTRFNHYLLLVDAMHFLLKYGSTDEEIDRAESFLFSFCRNFECLYEKCYLRLNVHQLLHLPDCVRDLGPLYTHSCFSFESKNGLVLKMIRGTQSIDTQIITAVSFIQKLPELKQRFVETNSDIDRLCKAIEEPTSLKRGQKVDSGIYVLGAVCLRKLRDQEINALQIYLGYDSTCDTFKTFNRIEYREYTIYGSEYSRMKKRNNSIVLYENQANQASYGEVQFFLIIEGDLDSEIMQTLVFVKKIQSSSYSENAQILAVTQTDSIEVLDLNKIRSSCMLIDYPGARSSFVCTFPNRLESD